MDAIEKRAAGEVLSARDEQRLRNHQLRMMRRQFLRDMIHSPREPLYPQNNVQPGSGIRSRLATMKHGIQAFGADFLVPKNRNWTYKAIFWNEFAFGQWKLLPRLLVWSAWRYMSVGLVYIMPVYVTVKFYQQQILLGRFPTMGGHLISWGTDHITKAAQTQVFPSDSTFTTRLRNIEWGHEAFGVALKQQHSGTPRMNPEAVTYPQGTRMNWVTWQPILPENNDLLDEDYGNGPGGKGSMTETYRLLHMTKERGLYSRTNPDDPNTPMSWLVNTVIRPITGYEFETDGGASRMK